uniref:leucine-rich repeat and guanylate kinase domain-containing protein isoform X2 n=1 Tax=Myxine glutinosa TaxID=7769 RepID=UPI00358E62A9
MANLSGFPRLCKLVIDQNEIVSLWGLEQCDRLSYLSLAYNRIKRAEGVGRLPLAYLCLRNNDLENILGMDGLSRLQELDVASNQICSLRGLEGLQFLHTINVESNFVANQQETRHLQALSLLRSLDIRNNPIQDGQEYRLHTIFILQKLTKLDGEIVTIKEKVTAINNFGPPAEVVAAEDHITNKVFALLQPQKIYHSTPFSINCPYPMLVLTGPLAGGKQELAQQLCEEFGKYLGHGTCHTTRKPHPGEEEGREYYFVTAREFGDMTLQGRFIETSQHDGELYGLSMDAIEELAAKGLSCVLHMELEDVLILKRSQFEPRCFLICPHKEALVSHMQKQGLYGEAQMRAMPSRIDTYLQMHQDRPGFFCAAIRSDDLDRAYRTLRTLVYDYLGVKENHNGILDNIPVPVESHQKPQLHHATNFINAWHQSSQAEHTSFRCHHTTAKYMELSHKYCGMQFSFHSLYCKNS